MALLTMLIWHMTQVTQRNQCALISTHKFIYLLWCDICRRLYLALFSACINTQAVLVRTNTDYRVLYDRHQVDCYRVTICSSCSLSLIPTVTPSPSVLTLIETGEPSHAVLILTWPVSRPARHTHTHTYSIYTVKLHEKSSPIQFSHCLFMSLALVSGRIEQWRPSLTRASATRRICWCV